MNILKLNIVLSSILKHKMITNMIKDYAESYKTVLREINENN